MPKNARHTAATLLAAALLLLGGTAAATVAADSGAGAHGGWVQAAVHAVPDGLPCNSCGG